MPRQVDREQRRAEIIRTAKELIAERGLGAVSFREIGKRMGGSTTLVTHYYATQSNLLEDIASAAVDSWVADLAKIEADHPDPVERLHALLFEWVLPLEAESLLDERARINFVAANLQGINTQGVLDAWEGGFRKVLTSILAELVAPDEVTKCVDVLRVAFNGLALSTVEHPAYWPPEKQARVLSRIVESLGLPARGAPRASLPDQKREAPKATVRKASARRVAR